ncbi:MAG: tetratricopeptide repeat protein, partial [Proteobacteria bacterium]|nr:tetratricopeptide repeat protein [Pseudomonadota bacterium]
MAPVEQAAEPVITMEQDEGLTAELLYDLLVSNLAMQGGELEIASAALIRAARTTGDPVLIARAVRMAVHSKNYVEAVELGQRWIEIAPKDYQARIITALAAVMDQQATIAADILRSTLAQSPDRLGLRFGQLGEMFLQYAEGETAQGVLTELANEYPDSPEAWLVLAGMAQKNKDLPGMNSALDRILSLEPGSETAAGYKLLALAEDPSAQTKFASAFLKNNPDASTFRMQYARLLLRTEKEVLALDQMLNLLRRDPKNSEALSLVALLYQAQQDYKKASKYFTRKLKATPDDDRSRLYLANALQELERYDEAKKVLSQVSDVDEIFAAGRQMSLLIEQADGAEAGLAYLETMQGKNEAQAVQLIIDRELMLQRAGRVEEAYVLIS